MNDKNPIVSVVIVAYNCESVIQQCIESLIGQECIEIIIIDNHSTDKTSVIIKTFLQNIVFIENSQNLGFTKACNQGISIARGKYIFLLNPDAYVTPSAISILLEKIESDHAIGAVSPKLLFPNGTIQNYNRRFPRMLGVLIESFVPNKYWSKFSAYNHYTYADIDLNAPQDLEQPAGAAILFRNEFLLDENYFIYGSDVELCKNVIDKGYQIKLVPEAEVFHHQSQGGTGDVNPRLRTKLQLDFYFAMRYFFKKHYGLLYSAMYVLINIIFLTLIALLSLISFSFIKIKLKFHRLFSFIKNENFNHTSI